MKTLLVVQARTASTRLPAKVLLPLLGKSVLARQLERISRAQSIDEVVVATTQEQSDDLIVQVCKQEQLRWFRGSSMDCLDRHYRCALEVGADVIVKVPSDCPLIDPQAIDRVVGFFQKNVGRYDFVSNLHPPSYPDGNDVEVMTMNALEKAWHSATRDYEREHTTPYIWDQPELFRCANVCWETGLNYSRSHRWTLDYEADYHFVFSVYNELYATNPHFTLNDILELVERKPEIARLNDAYAGLNWYRHHLSELRTVDERHTRILIGT